jgi:hypothetical protein
MKGILFAILAMMTLATNSDAVLAETSNHETALAFLQRAKVGQNLSAIALAAARQTVSFSVIASKLGNDNATKALSEEIIMLLPGYQVRWDDCIAQAYENTFTGEELSSLASEGRESKYAPKVVAQQRLIAQQLESTAKPVLIDLVTRALSATMSKYP